MCSTPYFIYACTHAYAYNNMAATATPHTVRHTVSCLGVDPGTSNIGVAWLLYSANEPASHTTPLEWALHGAWTGSVLAVGKDGCSAGPDALDAVIDAAKALRAPLDAPCVVACIEKQPNAVANPTVRMAEAAVHGVLSVSMPCACRVHQDGRVKNVLVDAVLQHMHPAAATLKFRKVPRARMWHATDGDGTKWCTVQHLDTAGMQCTLYELPRRQDIDTPHMQPISAQALFPGARKRARKDADARLDRRSAEDAKWRANKSCGEAAATALLCYRTHTGQDVSATKALQYMAALDSAHRHDVCDALLHALAGSWNHGNSNNCSGGECSAVHTSLHS